MNFDNQETRSFEESFQRLLQQARQMTNADFELVGEKIEKIKEIFIPILNKQNPTPEERAFALYAVERLTPIVQRLNDTMLVLGESIFRQSEAFYLHVKALAENGDEKAKEIYDDLKPLYEASLRESLGLDNGN